MLKVERLNGSAARPLDSAEIPSPPYSESSLSQQNISGSFNDVGSSSGTVAASLSMATTTTTTTTTTATTTGGMTFAQQLYASAFPGKYTLPAQSPSPPQSQASGTNRPASVSSNASGSRLSEDYRVSPSTSTSSGVPSSPSDGQSLYAANVANSVSQRPGQSRPSGARLPGRSASTSVSTSRISPTIEGDGPVTQNGAHRAQSYQAGASHTTSSQPRPVSTTATNSVMNVMKPYEYSAPDSGEQIPEVKMVLRPASQSPSMPVPRPGWPSPMLSSTPTDANHASSTSPSSQQEQQQAQHTMNSGGQVVQGQSPTPISSPAGSSVGHGHGQGVFTSGGTNVGPQSPTPSTHSFNVAGGSPTSVGNTASSGTSYSQPASPGQGVHPGSPNGIVNGTTPPMQVVQQPHQVQTPVHQSSLNSSHWGNANTNPPVQIQQPPFASTTVSNGGSSGSSSWGTPQTQTPVHQSSLNGPWGNANTMKPPAQTQQTSFYGTSSGGSGSGSFWGKPHTHTQPSANMVQTQPHRPSSGSSFFSSFWGKPVQRPSLYAQQPTQFPMHAMASPPVSPPTQGPTIHPQTYASNTTQPGQPASYIQQMQHPSQHVASPSLSGPQVQSSPQTNSSPAQTHPSSFQGVPSPPAMSSQNMQHNNANSGMSAYGAQTSSLQTPTFSPQQTQPPSTSTGASPNSASVIAGQLGRFAGRLALNMAKRTALKLAPTILSGLAAAILPNDLIQSVSDSLANLDLTNTGIDLSQLQAAFQGTPGADYQGIINQMQQLQQQQQQVVAGAGGVGGNSPAGQSQQNANPVNYDAIIHALMKLSQVAQSNQTSSQGQPVNTNIHAQGQGQVPTLQQGPATTTSGFANQPVHHGVSPAHSPAATQQHFQSQTPMHTGNLTHPGMHAQSHHAQSPMSHVQPQYHPQQHQTNPPRPPNVVQQQTQPQYHPQHQQQNPSRPPNVIPPQQIQPQYHPQQQVNPPRPPNVNAHPSSNAGQQHPYHPPQQQPHHPPHANPQQQQQPSQSPLQQQQSYPQQQQQEQSYSDTQPQTIYPQQQSYPQDQYQYQDPNQYGDQTQYSSPDLGYQNQDSSVSSDLPNYGDQPNADPGYDTQGGQFSESQDSSSGLSGIIDGFQNMLNGLGNQMSGNDDGADYGNSGFGDPSYGDPNSGDVNPPAFSDVDPNAMGMGSLDGSQLPAFDDGSYASVSVSETDVSFVDGSGGGFEFLSETVTATSGSDVFTESVMSFGDGNYTTITELSYSST
ncbi:hypothetical protein K435DRAFT_443818 [Dendrothele bispora CBS 962.96]|uniref:Uncharacterized protein n=1 Tax=Dendrothele bispora (strain CBS 962.96) TaxID=1314807 RepID=A0A4S8MDW4_DENBC|nr:hypothetical protein K435DRAFT_443818 [Dendrothele bispora CBS 962.96]